PDLRVSGGIAAPASVRAGGEPFDVGFEVRNAGQADTGQTKWIDRVYFSADQLVSPDDIVIGVLPNQTALLADERYVSTTPLFRVPERYSGDFFLIVVADDGRAVDEYPNEGNNQ